MTPWQMWASDAQLIVTAPVGLPGPQLTTPQLSRVDYGRPETWQFFFFANLAESNPGPGGSPCEYTIAFDVFLGNGRSAISIPNFCVMKIGSNDASPSFSRRWTTSTRAPVYDPLETEGPIISEFVAQSINCSARVQITAGSVTDPAIGNVIVSASFAPKSHVRPEWFRPSSKFRGGEDNGL